jgi:hypothetical protein
MKKTSLYMLIFLSINMACTIQAQIEPFTLVGFQDGPNKPSYGNAAVFFLNDTVLVDSIAYRLPTAGIGSGYRVSDTILMVQNGDLIHHFNNTSIVPSDKTSFPISPMWPFKNTIEEMGLPMPQGGFQRFRRLNNIGRDYRLHQQVVTHQPGRDLLPHHLQECVSSIQSTNTGSFRIASSNTTEQEYDFFFNYKDKVPTKTGHVQAGNDLRFLYHVNSVYSENIFFVQQLAYINNFVPYAGNSIVGTFKPNTTDTITSCDHHGASVFSPNGKVYAHWGDCKIQILDFDRCTGKLSNYRELIPPSVPMVRGGGLAFSASNRYLYIADYSRLYRIDLQSATPRMELAILNFPSALTTDPRVVPGCSFGYLYLAPDNKIYVSAPARAKFLHVINQPDAPVIEGIQFRKEGLKLPVYNLHTLPANFNPHLGLLPNGGGLCDTITLSSSSVYAELDVKFAVQPNPATHEFFWQVFISDALSTPIRFDALRIFNASGVEVVTEKIGANQLIGAVDCSAWAQGVYFMQLSLNGTTLVFSKVTKV